MARADEDSRPWLVRDHTRIWWQQDDGSSCGGRFEDRQLLYAWAWTKVKRGRFLSDFAAREGANSKTIRRAITRICQRIADDLNQKHVAWVNNRVDDVSEILAYEPTDSLPEEQPERPPSHMMMPDAKPRSDLSPEAAKAIAKEIEKLNRRNRGRKRA